MKKRVLSGIIRSGSALMAAGFFLFASVASVSATDDDVFVGDDIGDLDGDVVDSTGDEGRGDVIDPVFVSDPVDQPSQEPDDDLVVIVFDGSGTDKPNPTPEPAPPTPKGESYSISYVMNGGVNYGSGPTSVDYNQTFSVANPTRNGYVFLGWDVTGMDSSEHCIDYGITFDTAVYHTYATSYQNLRKTAGTVTFTAQWKIPASINGVNGLVANGNSQALVSEAGVPNDATVEYLLNGQRVSFPTASAAGNYDIEYRITAPGVEGRESGYLSVTIAQPSVRANLEVSGYNGTYDGNEHCVHVKVTPSGTAVEFSTDDSGWTSKNPKFLDVINKRVYVRVVDDTSINAYADVVIKKKDATIYFSTNFPASINQNTTFSTDFKLDAGNPVTMTSSNPSVLAVNYTGSNVTLTPGNATGTVTITVKADESVNYNGLNQQYNVTVNPTKITGLTINPSSMSIPVGTVGRLTVTGSPANAPLSNLLYASSDNSVATVDAYGNVTGLKPGKVAIGVYCGDVKAVAVVEVYSPTVPTVTVALDRNTASIVKGTSFTLTPAVAVNDNSLSKALSWSTSDKSVATVSNGDVKGLKAGTADITAKTVTGNTAVCRVTVTDNVVPAVKAVVIDPTANIGVGDTRQLSLILYPEGVTDKVTWSTTDSRVVIVNGGLIEGVAPGTAVIKATSTNGQYSCCAVTVFDLGDTSAAAAKAQENTKEKRANIPQSASAAGRTPDVSAANDSSVAIWKNDNAPAQEDIFTAQNTGNTNMVSNPSPQATGTAVKKDQKKGFSMGLIVAALVAVGIAATAGIVAIGKRM